MILSRKFRRRIEATFGKEGTDWLKRLPGIIRDCEDLWSLAVGPSFQNLSYNYVAPATGKNGLEAVLKIGVPRLEFEREIEALRTYDGRGSVQLHDARPGQGIMLLERLKPGKMIIDICPDNDKEATAIAAGVMCQLWQPAAYAGNFKKIEAWFEGLAKLRLEFDGGCGPFPRRLVEMAELLYKNLQQSQGEPVLLHGDLHHYNILSATRKPWLAIDPKGVTGEAEYEVGALLRNPIPHILIWPDLDQLLQDRVSILAEILGFDRHRVLAWGLAQAVLSAWWSYESRASDWRAILPVAEHLSKLINW